MNRHENKESKNKSNIYANQPTNYFYEIRDNDKPK